MAVGVSCCFLLVCGLNNPIVTADADSGEHLDGVNPKDGSALNARAMFYAERNEPNRALPFFLAAIKTGPGASGEYWNNLGVCYMRLRKWDDARIALVQATNLDNGMCCTTATHRHHPCVAPKNLISVWCDISVSLFTSRRAAKSQGFESLFGFDRTP